MNQIGKNEAVAVLTSQSDGQISECTQSLNPYVLRFLSEDDIRRVIRFVESDLSQGGVLISEMKIGDAYRYRVVGRLQERDVLKEEV